MSKYIDADALRQELILKQLYFRDNSDERFGMGCVIATLDNLPAADVVEVVRCKDCKHSVRYECKNDVCYKFTMCRRRDSYSEGVEDDDFCSYGERRSEDAKR